MLKSDGEKQTISTIMNVGGKFSSSAPLTIIFLVPTKRYVSPDISVCCLAEQCSGMCTQTLQHNANVST